MGSGGVGVRARGYSEGGGEREGGGEGRGEGKARQRGPCVGGGEAAGPCVGGGARLGDEAMQLLPERGRLEARHLALQLSQRRTQRTLAAVGACLVVERPLGGQGQG